MAEQEKKWKKAVMMAIVIGVLDVLVLFLGTFKLFHIAWSVGSMGVITFLGILMLVNYLSESAALDKGEMRKAIAKCENHQNTEAHPLQNIEHHIEHTELIGLWKYFSQRADQLSDKLWTISTWLIILAIGIVSYTAKVLLIKKSSQHVDKDFWAALVFLGVALVICIYTYFGIIRDFGKHIVRNQKRASYLASRILPLKEVIDIMKNDEKEGGPGVVRILSICSLSIGGFSLILILWFIIELLKLRW